MDLTLFKAVLEVAALIAYIYAGYAVAMSILHEDDPIGISAPTVMICLIFWPVLLLAVFVAFAVQESQWWNRGRRKRR